MKTDLFQSCGHCWVFQFCWNIECGTFTASSSRIWNSSTGIPSSTSAAAAAAAKLLQSCPTLCDPIDSSPPGSPIPGILQTTILEWVAISFSNAWKWKVKVKSLSLCPTLRDPRDCSLPGSSVHGIFQARVLEWGAIAFSITSVWDECNCVVVWAFFGIALL